MSYNDDIAKIETKANEKKISKAKGEERLETALKNKAKKLEELKETGVSQEELESKISELKTKLQEGIEKCQTLLN